MNKEKILQYYNDKLKQHERHLDEILLNEGMEWQPFLGLFFGRHLFLIINWS